MARENLGPQTCELILEEDKRDAGIRVLRLVQARRSLTYGNKNIAVSYGIIFYQIFLIVLYS